MLWFLTRLFCKLLYHLRIAWQSGLVELLIFRFVLLLAFWQILEFAIKMCYLRLVSGLSFLLPFFGILAEILAFCVGILEFPSEFIFFLGGAGEFFLGNSRILPLF